MSENKYRHELKFVCPASELWLIEDRIGHICERDSHAGAEGVYQIRSVYFDTCNDACYYENKAGVNQRHKYRIRIYNEDYSLIKLERKSSLNGLKQKEACLLTSGQCRQLLEGLYVEDVSEEQTVLQEFLTEQSMTLLTPKVIVKYERAPYVYPVGNVRITFDRYIAAAPVGDFWRNDLVGINVLPGGQHVLEVKYDDMLPGAIMELIGSGGNLQRTSFSKYTICRECFL